MADKGPIRVLRIIARLNVGGPSLHVAYLTDLLDERGYQTVLATGVVGEGEGSMEHVAKERGIVPYRLSVLQREVAPVLDAVAIFEIWRLIRRFRPDVLHTHTAKAGAAGRIAALFAGRARPKVVVHTYHGHVLRGYFSMPLTWLFRLVERWLARSTDALVAVSPEVRDDLVRFRVAPPDRFRVIRLGLDLDRRTTPSAGARERERAALGATSNQFVVAWLGRMTEVKRVDDLLRAFAILLEHDADAVLVLAGDGPLRPAMEELAGSLGIADSVRFVGYRDDVTNLYAAADVVALTSINEGTPVTLIEALAAGRPVVATDVGGVRDVVADGVSGFLVPAQRPALLADRLAEMALDAELRARFGAAGAEFVRAQYAVPRLVDDIDALYRDLLEAKEERAAAQLTPPLVPALGAEARRRIPPAPRRMRIVLLSQYFPPEIGATQSRMQSFAEYLALRGHKVTVIAEFPNHPHGVIPDRYRGHLVDDDRSNDYRVLRVWVKASHQKTQATRIAFYLSYASFAAAVAPLAGRADVVVATTPPLFVAAAGVPVARANRAPLVLDVRDLWPAAAVSLSQMSDGVPLALAESLERFLYREAAAVIAVTRPFCEHIAAIRGHRPPPPIHIPNATLEQFFEEDGSDGHRAELGLSDDRFVVTFAGTHGIAQGLSAVLDGAARTPEIDWVFVGDGPVKDDLVRVAASRELANVHFRGPVPLDRITPLLRASDALLVPLSAHPTFETFVPSKLIDFMAVGRPVVLAAAGEAARIVEKAGAGVVAAPEDPADIAAAARSLAADAAAARAMGERGREFARRRLRAEQAERLEQVLFDVVDRRSRNR